MAQGPLSKAEVLTLLAELRTCKTRTANENAFVEFAKLVDEFLETLDGDVLLAMSDKQVIAKHSLRMICKQ